MHQGLGASKGILQLLSGSDGPSVTSAQVQLLLPSFAGAVCRGWERRGWLLCAGEHPWSATSRVPHSNPSVWILHWTWRALHSSGHLPEPLSTPTASRPLPVHPPALPLAHSAPSLCKPLHLCAPPCANPKPCVPHCAPPYTPHCAHFIVHTPLCTLHTHAHCAHPCASHNPPWCPPWCPHGAPIVSCPHWAPMVSPLYHHCVVSPLSPHGVPIVSCPH